MSVDYLNWKELVVSLKAKQAKSERQRTVDSTLQLSPVTGKERLMAV
jgi:hypothetical protein